LSETCGRENSIFFNNLMQIFVKIIRLFYESFSAVSTLFGSTKKYVTGVERGNDSEELN